VNNRINRSGNQLLWNWLARFCQCLKKTLDGLLSHSDGLFIGFPFGDTTRQRWDSHNEAAFFGLFDVGSVSVAIHIGFIIPDFRTGRPTGGKTMSRNARVAVGLALAALLAAHAASASGPDLRDVSRGCRIYEHGYCDQPYVVVTDDGAWLCVFTTSGGHEGHTSQYVVCCTSKDQGRTWSEPVPLESPDGPEASWAMPLLTHFGRVYVFYTYNGDDVRTLPDGKKMRADTHGWYCYRYSDDNGATWPERFRLPMRVTACDRGNDFSGSVQMFWGIGKPVTYANTAWFAFTKLARYFLEDGEGWFYRSGNVLTEPDVSQVVWELLPEGDHGLRHPAFGSVQEEHNLVPLSNGNLYCIYRTTLGHPAESYSRDGGRTWSTPEPVRYADGRPVKTPRACPRLWRTQDGKYLFWFHNHSGTDFRDRNPAWLSGGVEQNGRIRWSQPEILLYGDDLSYETGRFSYPDLIEQDGRYWVTTTQKTQATVHAVDPTLLAGLWGQMDNREAVRDGLVLDLESPAPGEVTMPTAARLAETGITIGLRVTFDGLEPGQELLDTRDKGGRGLLVSLAQDGQVQITLNDGEREDQWQCDPGLLRQGTTHHITVIVDDGPNIISFVVDGRLCDGGNQRQFGWGRFSPAMGGIAVRKLRIAPSLHGRIARLRVYDRYLRTSEALGNFQRDCAM